MLVDTHCHLNRLDQNVEIILAHAKEHQVGHFLCVAVTLDDDAAIKSYIEKYPTVYGSSGLHPNEEVEQEPTVEQLITLANHDKIIAVGETGLDYYRSEGELEWQRQRFRTHIHAAKKINKPLIVHTRNASADTIRIMQEEGANDVRGIMHCFTESWEVAKAALDLGFYISFSGIVTFANAKDLNEIAKKVPLDRLLVETDCPYLAPVPFRGKPNQPAYTYYVAQHLAKLLQVPFDRFAEQTTANFFELFKCQA